jgi:hypothetical protein
MARFRVQPNLFSYAELKAATRSFHPDNKLGEGGYGAVFKVCITHAILSLILSSFPSGGVLFHSH